MPGIETAGLVLGALPLLIEAIKAYREHRGPIFAFIEPEAALDSLMRELKYQNLHFRDILEKLFKAAMPYVDVKVAIRSKQHVVWDKAVVTALAGYLKEPERLEIVQQCMQEYENTLVKIATTLRLIEPFDEDGIATLATILALGDTHHSSSGLRRRIQIVRRGSELARLTKKLKQSILELGRFVNDARDIHQIETQVPAPDAEINCLLLRFDRTREYTSALLRAFRNGWSSECRHNHQVLLPLDSTQNNPRHQTTRLISHDFVKIDVLLGQGPPLTRKVKLSAYGIVPDQRTSNWRPVYINEGQRLLRKANFHTPDPIGNICQHILDSINRSRKAPVGIALTGHIYDVEKLNLEHTLETSFGLDLHEYPEVHLDQVLERREILPPETYVGLAFTLATSLLQLHHESCFNTVWSAEAICFPQKELDKNQVNIDQPFFCQNFPKAVGTEVPETRHSKSQIEQAIFELGVLFIQLQQGKSLEEWAQSADVRCETLWDKKSAAWQWCYELAERGQLLPDFFDSVSVCIKFSFEGLPRTFSWDNPILRRAICAKVIMPLARSCQALRI